MANSSLQFLRKIAGKPSGPGAAFGEMSSMAAMMSLGLKTMSESFVGSLSISNSSSGLIGSLCGMLKTDEY